MNYSYIETDSNTIDKTVKIYPVNIHPRWIKLINESVRDKIHIVIDKENPDYLIYATFGCDYLSSKYNNTIKIAFFTENQIPDLNVADYAVGFSHISYLDRYLNLPYFIYFLNRSNLYVNNYTIARKNALKYYKNRNKFCAAVISNHNGLRIDFMNEISKYKEIDQGGYYHNNVGGRIHDKIKFLSQYKFSISMENSDGDGYLTEKILDSFLAGTIPIYYGDFMMDEFINPKSFILIRNKNDLKEKIEYIKKIDNDDKLYESILKEKIFIDDNDDFIRKIEKTRNDFLLNIFEQKKELAKRKDKLIFSDY